jgi:predicted ATP-dependent endonuclease of OLD family
MRYTHFRIKNFKGIKAVEIDLTSRPKSNIFTLVGLNESGKTTILQALNFTGFKSETLDPLDLHGYSISDVHELIPISKRANFNDEIVVETGYEFSIEDSEKLSNLLYNRLGFKLTKPVGRFTTSNKHTFRNSRRQASTYMWNISFLGKKKRASTERKLVNEEWRQAVEIVKSLLPSILYFPNFLFDFPDRIYLEEPSSDKEKHEFYRTILQDVLDSIGDGADLNSHILERAKSSSLFDKRALESVLLKMGSHISSTVFKNWDKIFKREIGRKEIVVDSGREDDSGLYYIELRLKDSHELYTISERSLGFRWFFAFLLLTQYRGFRKNAPKDVLFLLDEPASNLHPSAQSQLLESFGRFPETCSIIYTTHSHHMINPDWLEGAYVVRNEGLDYESEDTYNARDTVITLERYRKFAAEHPNQTTYFQPVLDVLDYSPSKLEAVKSVVLIEGKNDFYTLKYMLEIIFARQQLSFGLVPGTGSGSLDNIVRLYLGWGRDFIILLDSDRAGVDQKNRYEEIFGPIVQDKTFLLNDIDGGWKKIELENLVAQADKELIQQTIYPDAVRYNKTHFNRAIQELYLTKKALPLSAVTISAFKAIIDFCDKKLRRT